MHRTHNITPSRISPHKRPSVLVCLLHRRIRNCKAKYSRYRGAHRAFRHKRQWSRIISMLGVLCR